MPSLPLIVLFLVSVVATQKVSAYSSFLAYQNDNDSSRMGGPGTDRSYSNGFKWTYGFEGEDQRIYSFAIAQKIFTPENTRAKTLLTDDQPYAGWLYGAFGASFYRDEIGHAWEISLGTVGPSALGQEVQHEFHRLSQDPRPQGWAHELKDEPTLQLSYQLRRPFLLTGERTSYYADLIPYGAVGLGNVLIAAQAGGFLRAGYGLGDSLMSAWHPGMGSGPPGWPKDSRSWGVFGFVGLSGAAVAHNLFLDGNTYQSSHSVDKLPFVHAVEWGVALRVKQVLASWRHITVSPEFRERRRYHDFASFQISLFFGDP